MDEKIKGTEARKLRERMLRRDEILKAATEVFAQRGYSQVTLDEIADKAEFGKGTLYNYFQNKEELFHAVVFDGLEKLGAVATEICTDPRRDVVETYLRLSKALLSAMFSNRGMLSVIFREFHTHEQEHRLFSHFQGIVEIVEKPLLQIIKDNPTFPIAPRRFAITLLSSIIAQFRCSVIGCAADFHDLAQRTARMDQGEIQREVEDGVRTLEFTTLAGLKQWRDSLSLAV